MATPTLMAFAITVTIFAGDADNIRITHNDVLTPDACAKWKALSKTEKPRTVDPTGRLIKSVSYECVPIIPADLAAKLSNAKAAFP